MQGLSILLIGVGILMILINILINFGNLAKISIYCIQTNTLDQYWSAWFKSGVSGRAIISSIIGFVIALGLFFIVAPIVLIRKVIFNKKVKEYVENGLWIDYSQIKPNPDIESNFHTNIGKLGLDFDPCKIYHDVKLDIITILGTLSAAGEKQGKKVEFKPMQEVSLQNGKKARIPILMEMENQKYPIYLVYNETQKNQFYKVGSQLEKSGYNDCFYFSVEKFA